MGDIVDERCWLIRKGGLYYRPNRSGYTASVHDAGRYTKAEAEREAAIEPWHMSAIHERDAAKTRDQATEADTAFLAGVKAGLEAAEANIGSALADEGNRDIARGLAQAEMIVSAIDPHTITPVTEGADG